MMKSDLPCPPEFQVPDLLPQVTIHRGDTMGSTSRELLDHVQMVSVDMYVLAGGDIF